MEKREAQKELVKEWYRALEAGDADAMLAVQRDDVIYNVHWRLNAEDDGNQDADGNNLTASVYGTCGLDTTDLGTFTAFADLEVADVQAWVEAGLGEEEVTSLKTALDGKIAETITPTSVTKTIGA